MTLLRRIARRLHAMVRQPLLKRQMRRLGISFYPPNYIYYDTFTPESVVADVGCGYEAEFSRHMIAEHGLRAFGVDPTRKHAPFLRQLEESTGGRFRHLPVAVSRENGRLAFHESIQNESGSILAEHANVRNDSTTTYEVESISLRELSRRLGVQAVDFLKLDLEGAEYRLFDDVGKGDLRPFKQLFVEFHHHCTNHSVDETRALVDRIRKLGFDSFTLDEHNYLFYRRR